MTQRPDIGEDGKIPCDCCNSKGLRHLMGTHGKNKEYYLCDKCFGTKRRIPPVGYDRVSQTEHEPTYTEDANGEILCDGISMTTTEILERLNK